MSTKRLIAILVGVSGIIVAIAVLFMVRRTGEKNERFELSALSGKENLLPIVIIGSGPAGLSAALYTARAGYKTAVFAGAEPGGQLSKAQYVENWPGKKKMAGIDAMRELAQQAAEFGAMVIYDNIKQVDLKVWPFALETDAGQTIHALAVIIATGLTPKKLRLPGVDEYWGKGVGTCVICDAPFSKDQDAVVIGGGTSAAEMAMQLIAHAKHVTIVVNEPELKAAATIKERLAACKNITILPACELESVHGDGTSVSGVTVKKTTTGERLELPARLVNISIGYEPQSQLFKQFVQTDKAGYISVQGRSQKTSLPGIFAAGNVDDNCYRKAGVATGEGVKAALDALAFFESIGFNAYVAHQMESKFYDDKQTQTQKRRILLIDDVVKFNVQIKESKMPVVVYFFLPACPTCVQLMPHLESIAFKGRNKALLVKVDISVLAELTQTYGIKSVPTLIMFKGGKEMARCEHIKGVEGLEAFVLEHNCLK